MSKKKQALQVANKPVYKYWQALFLAFYSNRLYIDVAKRWRGFGVIYLLLLIAVASIPLSTRLVIDFNYYFNEQMILPLQKLPGLYVQNGEVSFDKPMPYIIKNKHGEINTIIDTTGTITEIGTRYPALMILVTKNKVYFRPPEFHLFFSAGPQKPGDKIYIQPFAKDNNQIFVGKDWVASSGLSKVKHLTEIMIYPIITLFIFALSATCMLVFALLGQLFARIIFKFRVTFKEASRLFFVASTPSMFVFFIMLTANLLFPGAGMIFSVLMTIYFSFAILSVRKESNKMVRS